MYFDQQPDEEKTEKEQFATFPAQGREGTHFKTETDS